ncbi:MAG: TIGR02281 family clan AA aspartic protease [Proteobacteria bacterium]|nr:TIGR02281 family clan AA aspartic protease [Pseudomonadota bacterium]
MAEKQGPWDSKRRDIASSVPAARRGAAAPTTVSARVRGGSSWRRSSLWAGLWAGAVVLLILVYSFRFELGHLGDRVAGELLPYAAVTTADGVVRLRAQRDGHYYIDATIGRRAIRFLVDTGASTVVLSPADAERVGIDLSRVTFSQRLRTAGGIVRGAPIVIRELNLGSIRLANISAIINESPMSHSLLGVSALEQLSSYEVRDGTLTLRPAL